MSLKISKTNIIPVILIALLSVCLFAAVAGAATTTTSIVLTVVDNPGKAINTNLSDTIGIYDSKFNLLKADTDYSAAYDATKGTYTITGSGLTTGDYLIGAYIPSEDTIPVRAMTKATVKAGAVTPVKLLLASASDAKVGAIGGTVYDASKSYAQSGVFVAVSNAATTWSTVTDNNGKFAFYLPAGPYICKVYGADMDACSLTVVAGQMCCPLTAMTGSSSFTDEESMMNLTLTTPSGIDSIDTTTKKLAGTVNADATVYVRDIANDKLLATCKPTAPAGSAVGTWTSAITPTADMKIEVMAIDRTGYNSYSLSMNSTIGSTLYLNLAAAPVDFGKDATITFTDTGKKLTAANVRIYINDNDLSDPLPSSQFIFTAGSKIVIKAAAFPEVGTYNIEVVDAGNFFAEAYTTLVVKASTTTAVPALTVTAKVGTDKAGDTILTPGTPVADDTFAYLISSTAIATPKMGEKPASGAAALSTETYTVSGVDPVNNKYLGIYEVSAKGYIVKFKCLTLTAAQIKLDTTAPTLDSLSIDADNKVISLKFNCTIYKVSTAAALKSAVKLATNGTTFAALAAGDSVSILDDTLTITLATALTGTTNKIQIAASALQSTYAVKNAVITTDSNDNWQTAAGDNANPGDLP